MRTVSLALRSPGELGAEPVTLFLGEELRLLGLVGQHEIGHDADDHGGDALGEIHDLPALQSEQPVQAHQRRRDRRARRDRHRQADQEARDDARVVAGGEPVGEVEDEAGEEAGFGHAQQEAHDAEAHGSGDQRGGRGEDAQVTMMRAIQMRAPTFSMITFEGTSNRK